MADVVAGDDIPDAFGEGGEGGEGGYDGYDGRVVLVATVGAVTVTAARLPKRQGGHDGWAIREVRAAVAQVARDGEGGHDGQESHGRC
ncbi:hypothetical protein [Actinomadura rubrisoli]|uniref:Uncharacterized protein n=1 Tax=Actinomadura rubrisoli TaxID=2530368 RepID=A0A4R5BH89_9ACTN|nr:hypothetical protein [Actinomadura rubrisoli]TDD85851.1 hypothetical protein E1298_18135 [Actinomadura rubrisoli]